MIIHYLAVVTTSLLKSTVSPSIPPAILSGGIWEILANTSFFGALVLAVLVIMSLVSWGIMVNKYRLYREVNYQTKKFSDLFSRSSDLKGPLGQLKLFRITPLSAIYASGIKEAEALRDAKSGGGVNETRDRLGEDEIKTVAMMLEKSVAEETGKLEKYVVFLATTANAAPFLGLLGTVVGVMDSFWSIGERGSASLTVVAPGIAEALLATIVGLAAAIPAVIGYNWANNKLKFIHDRANNFSLEFLARLKRESYL